MTDRAAGQGRAARVDWSRRLAWPAWVLVAAAAALTAAASGAALGWALEVAAAFRPHYAVVAGLCAAVMLVTRRWAGAALALAVVVANGVVLAPLWVDQPGPAEPGTPTLTVLWHNVHGIPPGRFDEAAAAARRSDADVVLFSQVGPAIAASVRAGDYAPYTLVYDHEPRLMVLARPAVAAAPLPTLPAGSRDAIVDLRTTVGHDRPVAILGMHTRSPRTPERAATRDAELALGATWAAAQEGATVVVGDLNTPPWSPSFRDLAREGGLRDSLRGHGLQTTWPARWGPAGVPIDHLLHSPDLTVLARSTGPGFGAFHRSLLVTLGFARPAPGPGGAVSVTGGLSGIVTQAARGSGGREIP